MLLLNLGIIKYRLTDEPVAVCGTLHHDMVLHTVRLMSAEPRPEYSPNHLYVMQWDQRPESPVYPQYMVCVGGGAEAEQFFLERGINCLIFKESVDIALLLAEIQDIFNGFSNLHTEYRLLLITRQPMNTILDFCSSFMKNFTFLLDAKYGLIETGSFYSSKTTKAPGFDKSKMMPLIHSIASRIKDHCQEAEKENPHLVEYMPASDDTPEFMYSRFFDGNDSIATLVICSTARPFYPFTAAMLQYLANLLQPCIEGRYSPSVKTHGYIRKSIFSLLEDKGCNLNALLHNLSLIGWNIHDSYQLIYIRSILSDRRHFYSASDYYRYENLFPDCLSVSDPTHSHAVLVIHNATGEISANAMNSLTQLMTANKMECRISLPFNNFLDIKAHFDLVQSSLLSMGERRKCVSMYRDVMIRHIISEIGTSFPMRALCHQAAIKLHEHDLQNSTELLITLEKYLYNNRSIQKAGDALFIHRNTINYRLKKIEELTGLSLNGSESDLHLLLSCMVLRTLGEINSANVPLSSGSTATGKSSSGTEKTE